MVYITKANADQLLHDVRKGEIAGLDTGDLYKVELSILSKYEKVWLAKAREFFRNFDIFIDKIYQRRNAEDTFSYVYEGISPSFHTDNGCGALHSDYRNATIPDEIKKRGKDAVIKFRRWFKENQSLDGEKFIAKLKMDFYITDPNLKYFESPNSGVKEVENNNLEELEQKIDKILEDSRIFLNNLSEYDKRLILDAERYNESSTVKVVATFHQFKNDLKKNMLLYFRVKFNPDLGFALTLLEQIGFRQCQKCAINAMDVDLPF